jgi:MscS family membrane protein
VAIAISAWRTVDLVAEYLTARASRTTTKMDDVLIPLVRKTLKIFIVAFGLIYVADAFNIPTTPLLGMITALSLGFSFAAKDTVENFFGSVSVLFDRPFDVGDWVVVGDIEGIVEEVGFRSTRIRTFYNSQVTMPNANLVRATVDNYGRRRYRRWKTTVSLTYDTPAEKLVAFTEGIRELVRKHPYTRKDYYQVWMNEFGAHSLDVLLYVFHEVPDWQTELRERERLFLDIVRLAEHVGVEFAFPTQTIHLKQGEPEPRPEAGHIPTRFTDRRARVNGIRAARDVVANQDWVTDKPPPYTFGGQDPELAYDAAGNPIEPDPEETPESTGVNETRQTESPRRSLRDTGSR